jgi:hypothetical protein
MSKIKIIYGQLVLSTALLALTACGSSPAVVNTAQEAASTIDSSPVVVGAETPEIQSASTGSGLGPIVYEEPPPAVCKKRRRTGTNRRVSMCEQFVGSQPVRTISADDSTIIWGAIQTSTPANN